MAVPKRKTSKAKRNMRRANNSKVSVPGMTECPQCGILKLSHRVCKECGYYNKKQAVSIED